MGIIPADSDYHMFSGQQLGSLPGIDVASLLDAATYHTKHDVLARIRAGSLQVQHCSANNSRFCPRRLVSSAAVHVLPAFDATHHTKHDVLARIRAGSLQVLHYSATTVVQADVLGGLCQVLQCMPCQRSDTRSGKHPAPCVESSSAVWALSAGRHNLPLHHRPRDAAGT